LSEQINVVLIDDHALVRDSFSQRLDTEPGLAVVGTAGTAEEGLDVVTKANPDVVLMDIDMPGLSCFDAADRIGKICPAARVIFISAFCHDHYIEQALRVKARGYLTKSEPLSTVVEAVRQVALGKVWFSKEVRARLVADGKNVALGKNTRTRVSTLSTRESEVLGYLARGMSKKEVAQTMHVSIKTIEGHAEKLMSKLGIHDRVALARFAIREGLADA